MQSKRVTGRFCLSPAFLAILSVFLIVGCATTPPSNVSSTTCQIKKIDWQLVPLVEITAFECAMGRHEGEDSLIFTVGIMNRSQDPTRFRLAIFIPEMDKAVSYLVPSAGTPPVMAPGTTETIKIPFMKTTTFPRKIEVVATTVRVDD
ncbi:MAG: hypothetical protein KFF50_12685 [Desulfatitalea sp.]|nr:hypothetical protein [Desulfatitalea sp.]